jgi:hypothetical protein
MECMALMSKKNVISVVSVCFVCEAQFTQPPTVILGQVVSERNISLLFSGEVGSESL